MKASNIRIEAIAGLTTFFTMAYIVVVNPAILATEGTGMSFSGVLTATVLLSFLMTLFMGLYAKLPYGVAPGMGINAFFAYSIVLGRGVPWPVALGIVFWAGVFFILISVTPLRERIAQAIPGNLRTAAAAGIGLFITFIGLKNLGIVASDPVTLVRLGHIDRKVLLGLLGLVIILGLMQKKNPFAFLAGMFTVTALGFLFKEASLPEQMLSMPDFKSVLFKLDLVESLKIAYLPALMSILFTDLFDSISTFVGVSEATGLTDKNGEPKNLREGLIVDAFATMSAGLFGTSSGTAYIESAAGIEAGGRTGRTALVTALCFLPCFFIAPLAASVPQFATAPVLIAVGALMFRSVGRLDLKRLEDLLPAFLTVILIPLTFSITQGILWGFIAHTGLYLLAGRGREIRPFMYGLSLVSILLIVLDHAFA